VAAGAHFLVDLEAALELLTVELAERPVEAEPAFGPVRMLVIFELDRLSVSLPIQVAKPLTNEMVLTRTKPRPARMASKRIMVASGPYSAGWG
jgi:hypothetical protein